jgi:CheY-like chemotaxis protein
LDAIHNSGQHLLDMINDILDLSKIEAGKMELSIEEISLNEIISSVLSTAKGLMKEKQLELHDNTPEHLPNIFADRTRARQILLNLLQNAIKFTDAGSITLDVELIQDPDSNAHLTKIMVTDTGIGISEEDQVKLFERFSQVDSSLTRKVGGTGLGLSISRHLTEMQGGEMNVESILGQGSTFWFTLPVASEVVEEKPPIVEIEPDGRVVLAIDDDEKVINLYKRYLSSHGYQVVAITNPKEALQQVKRMRPFAITLDIMMPGKDGWQVIEDIKNDPQTKNIPIIICSIIEDLERGYKLGATDYLVKPILEDEFVRAIQRLNMNGDTEPRNILVVDDDPNVMPIIQKSLPPEMALRFQYADGGLKGLAMLREQPPDAVILDLFMPGMDGFDLLETMQKDPLMRQIPVIILTGADLNADQKQIIDKYKRDLIRKDMLREDDLAHCLGRALRELENPAGKPG